MKQYPLGNFLGLQLSYDRTAQISLLALYVVCVIIAMNVIRNTTLLDALIAGLFCTAIHFISEVVHQFGHAIAASRTGYPMIGIHFYLLLGRSIYPKTEPNLSPNTHIRRAMGGPIISVGMTLLFFIVGQIFPSFSMMWFVFMFGFIDNLVVFTLGALLPLNFTDGGAILKNIRAQQKITPKK